jgi:hypothetical protein
MRRLFLIPILIVLTAIEATAEGKWTGPGWYLWVDGGLTVVLLAGPYGSAKECERQGPQDLAKEPPEEVFDGRKNCTFFARDPEKE